MALINCPECGKEISDKAAICPHCGYSVKKYIKKNSCNKNDSDFKNKREKVSKQWNLRKFSGIKVAFLASVFAIVFVVVILILRPRVSNEPSMQSLEKALQSGNTQDALEIIEAKKVEDHAYIQELISGCTDSEMLNAVLEYIDSIGCYEEYEKDILTQKFNIAYNLGMFGNAKIYYSKLGITSDEEMKNKYNQAYLLNTLQGKWTLKSNALFYGSNSKVAAFHINGWNATFYHCSEYAEDVFEEVASGTLSVIDDNHVRFDENGISYEISSKNGELVAVAISDSFLKSLASNKNTLFDYSEKEDNWRFSRGSFESSYAPVVGMSVADLRKSTWGKPQEVNKTTYAWGTHEQWVYSQNRYVYLENGIVTAIKEYD